jgi:hypothetical protein
MAASNLATLSRNEQAMLDLALLCDLELSPETDRPAIRARHALIKTPADALVYIRAVEHKVHLRRKVTHLPSQRRA